MAQCELSISVYILSRTKWLFCEYLAAVAVCVCNSYVNSRVKTALLPMAGSAVTTCLLCLFTKYILLNLDYTSFLALV